MNNNIHDLNNKTSEVVRETANDVNAKKDQMVNKATQAADTMGRKAQDMAASASSTLEEYGIRTDVMTDKARQKTNEIQDAFIDEIRANPIRSVAIAAGAGFLVALFSRS